MVRTVSCHHRSRKCLCYYCTVFWSGIYRCSRLVCTLSTVSSRSKKSFKIVAVKMHFVRLASVSAFGFSHYAVSQLMQTIIDDGNGKSIYVLLPGSTSSVAAPAPMPTLVYNWGQMPLICENVAAWWLKQDPNSNGNVPDKNFICSFDPDQTNKNKRRQRACGCFGGCFAHDDCRLSGTSNGKSRSVAVTAIVTDTVSTAITAYDPAATQVLIDGMSFDR